MADTDRQRSRLGRGMSALFLSTQPEAEKTSTPIVLETSNVLPEKALGDTSKTALLTIAVDSIDINPYQPRRQFDDVSLAELADSLKTNGLIQPLIVTPVGNRFELVAGERRLRAAKLAGLETLPAVVQTVDKPTQAQWALVENIQREDLNPLDRALAYQSLQTQLGLTQAELARRLGETRPSVANYLRILDLAEPVRQHIAMAMLSLGHAKVLAGLTDITLQTRLADQCVRQTLSVRELESLVAASSLKAHSTPTTRSSHIAELEKRLTHHLGLRVTLQPSPGNKRGKLIIRYGSLDQFDELLKKIGFENDE